MSTGSVNSDYSLSSILADISPGPSGSVQIAFARIQLAESLNCRNQSEDYMSQIERIQNEQKKCADMISQVSELLRQVRQEGGEATREMPADMREFLSKRELQQAAQKEKPNREMPADMREYLNKHGLDCDDARNDNSYNADEWEYNIKSLIDYQEQIANKAQMLLMSLQDFLGRYDSSLASHNNVPRGQ